MINTIVSFSQHTADNDAASGMPVFGRARVTSLRALPIKGAVSDVAVTTGAFPGTSAWSPPI